jgi:hypothetical protein
MRSKKQYEVSLPTVKRVVELFDYYRHDIKLVDESNCIQLTKLEEFVADEYQVGYDTEDYEKIEEACFGAYKRLLKRDGFNE